MLRAILGVLIFLIGCQAPKYPEPVPVYTLSTSFDRSNIDQYLITLLGELDHEEAHALFYKGHTFVGSAKLAEGGIDNVQYNMYSALLQCAALQCDGVVLAHNHPSGYFAQPSVIDVKSAKTSWAYLNTYKIELITSIVVARYDTRWY